MTPPKKSAAKKKTVSSKPAPKTAPKKKVPSKKSVALKTGAKKSVNKKAASKKSVAPRKKADSNGGAALTALKRRVTTVRKILEEHYPEPASALNSRNPFEMLCATILSAQCTDKKVNEITPALFEEYPDAASMADADPERLKELIRQTGFFNNKAKSLLGMSKGLVESHGGNVPGSMKELVKLPGVGRKTGWCILSKYFDQHGHIVDTHFKRITTLLGWHSEKDPEKIEAAMDRLVPEEFRSRLSHQIILHGRAICIARRPKCGECVLRQHCPSAQIDA